MVNKKRRQRRRCRHEWRAPKKGRAFVTAGTKGQECQKCSATR